MDIVAIDLDPETLRIESQTSWALDQDLIAAIVAFTPRLALAGYTIHATWDPQVLSLVSTEPPDSASCTGSPASAGRLSASCDRGTPRAAEPILITLTFRCIAAGHAALHLQDTDGEATGTRLFDEFGAAISTVQLRDGSVACG
jgi:hypothetical protein